MQIPWWRLITTLSLVWSLLSQQACSEYSEPVQVQVSYINEITKWLLLIEVDPSNVEGRKIWDKVKLEKEIKRWDINGDGREELISANIKIKKDNYPEGDYTIENILSGSDKKPKTEGIVPWNIIEISQKAL